MSERGTILLYNDLCTEIIEIIIVQQSTSHIHNLILKVILGHHLVEVKDNLRQSVDEFLSCIIFKDIDQIQLHVVHIINTIEDVVVKQLTLYDALFVGELRQFCGQEHHAVRVVLLNEGFDRVICAIHLIVAVRLPCDKELIPILLHHVEIEEGLVTQLASLDIVGNILTCHTLSFRRQVTKA